VILKPVVVETNTEKNIKNTEIRRRTQIKDIGKEMINKKWTWAGHVVKMSSNKWAKLIQEWYPRDGHRSRERV